MHTQTHIHTHTRTHKDTHPHTHTHTHSLSHSVSLSHTHTHTNTHKSTQAHTKVTIKPLMYLQSVQYGHRAGRGGGTWGPAGGIGPSHQGARVQTLLRSQPCTPPTAPHPRRLAMHTTHSQAPPSTCWGYSGPVKFQCQP